MALKQVTDSTAATHQARMEQALIDKMNEANVPIGSQVLSWVSPDYCSDDAKHIGFNYFKDGRAPLHHTFEACQPILREYAADRERDAGTGLLPQRDEVATFPVTTLLNTMDSLHDAGARGPGKIPCDAVRVIASQPFAVRNIMLSNRLCQFIQPCFNNWYAFFKNKNLSVPDDVCSSCQQTFDLVSFRVRSLRIISSFQRLFIHGIPQHEEALTVPHGAAPAARQAPPASPGVAYYLIIFWAGRFCGLEGPLVHHLGG